MRIGVIGAGVAGLACADALAKRGAKVTVFERARGIGGRCATRRDERFGSVDLGARFFTVEDPRFAAVVAEAARKKQVEVWHARIVHIDGENREVAYARDRWVGVPAMNSWLKDAFPVEDLRLETTVERLVPHGDAGWECRLAGDVASRSEAFDAIVLAMPPPQAARLHPAGASLDALGGIVMHSCWAVGLLLPEGFDPGFDAAFIRSRTLDWAARHASRPGRSSKEHLWVVHGSPEWSDQHVETDASVAGTLLADAFAETCGLRTATDVSVVLAHRWRWASPAAGPGPGVLWNDGSRIAVCGDWSYGGRLENAFKAGRAAADLAFPRGSPRA